MTEKAKVKKTEPGFDVGGYTGLLVVAVVLIPAVAIGTAHFLKTGCAKVNLVTEACDWRAAVMVGIYVGLTGCVLVYFLKRVFGSNRKRSK